MKKLKQSKSKSRKVEGVKCGTCPAIIFKENEAGGKIFVKEGKPICARCRILKGSVFAKEIKKDKKFFIQQTEAREKLAQEKEDEYVKEVALASQLKTKTLRGIIKKRSKK